MMVKFRFILGENYEKEKKKKSQKRLIESEFQENKTLFTQTPIYLFNDNLGLVK